MNDTATSKSVFREAVHTPRRPSAHDKSVLRWHADTALVRWALAVVITSAGIGTAAILRVATGADHLLVVFTAVLIVAWVGDTKTAFFVVAATSISAVFLAFDPVFSRSLDTAADATRLALFCTMAPITVIAIRRIRHIERDRDALMLTVSGLNEELTQANEAKDEFLSMVSHELRSPVAAIAADAHVLRREREFDNAHIGRASLLDIEQRAVRLGQVIDDLLTLARLDRGQVLPTEPILLDRVILRTIATAHSENGDREIRFVDESDRSMVSGCATYIERVLTNLLTNADKYSPPGQPVDVTTRTGEGCVVVSVLDRGSGIPAVEKPRIFEPFYRSTRTAASAPGAGVGLTVVKRLIEAQGGSIWIEDRDHGGSIFSFSLPRELV